MQDKCRRNGNIILDVIKQKRLGKEYLIKVPVGVASIETIQLKIDLSSLAL